MTVCTLATPKGAPQASTWDRRAVRSSSDGTPAGKPPQSYQPFWERGVFSVGSQFLFAHPPGRNAMCDFTEAERQRLTDARSLARDEEGREVLVGLTAQESDLLMAYRRRFTLGNSDGDPENLEIWLELAQRHELARPL